MTDEQHTREEPSSPDQNRQDTGRPDDFAGWSKDPEQTRTEAGRGSDYHPGATSVPKEAGEEDSDGMR